MPDEVGLDHSHVSAHLPPFPEKFYDLPDEQLGFEFWKYWCAYKLQGLRVRVDGVALDLIPPTLLDEIAPAVIEAIRRETFREDTANEALAGVEKALRLCASGTMPPAAGCSANTTAAGRPPTTTVKLSALLAAIPLSTIPSSRTTTKS
jgi:hypothetical protein